MNKKNSYSTIEKDIIDYFFNKEIPGYTNMDFVVHPFVYSLTQYPFYRIEGHTGMKVDEAIAAIKNLRRRYAISFDVISVTTDNLKEMFNQPFDDKEFAAYGLEHVCGVQKGYTLLLLHDGDKANPGIVIADFQVPFMMVTKFSETASPPPPPPPPSAPTDERKKLLEQWKKTLEKIGLAKTNADELRRINGVSAEIALKMQRAEINSYAQLSQLTQADIPAMAAAMNVKPAEIDAKWFLQAQELVRHIKVITLKDKIGTATGKDDLKKIKGIGENIETELNKVGIATYKQLSILTKEDIIDLAKEMNRLPHSIKEDWFTDAKKLIKK